jgi:hypothetical protein
MAVLRDSRENITWADFPAPILMILTSIAMILPQSIESTMEFDHSSMAVSGSVPGDLLSLGGIASTDA